MGEWGRVIVWRCVCVGGWGRGGEGGRRVIFYEPQRQKTYFWTCRSGEDSDQPAHLLNLIRSFTGCILDSQGCKISKCGHRRLIRLRQCAGWFYSSLGTHAKRYVSHVRFIQQYTHVLVGLLMVEGDRKFIWFHFFRPGSKSTFLLV